MRPRYSTELKVQAIRRVVHEGRPVVDVALEFGVHKGSVFFWVRRYREFVARRRVPFASRQHGQQLLSREVEAGDAGTLAAFLRRL